MCVTEAPRYSPYRDDMPIGMSDLYPEQKFIARVGELDLWLFRAPKLKDRWWIVCSEDRRKSCRPNYTGVGVTDGALVFTDTDVVPTPYEMCLLYQALEVHNDT